MSLGQFSGGLLLSLALLATCSCEGRQSHESETGLSEASPGTPLASRPEAAVFGVAADEPLDASLIELIATPERFRGRWVRVIGYVTLEFEGTAIYLHEEDFERSIMRNALWLDVDRNGSFPLTTPSYAVVEARFEPDRHGHMRLFSGSLNQIRRMSRWAGRKPSKP